MPFMINPKCKCCNDKLWHCKRCWNAYHNGEKHGDYIAPEYFGQSMLNEKVKSTMEKYGIKHNPSIKADKNREYREGEYH